MFYNEDDEENHYNFRYDRQMGAVIIQNLFCFILSIYFIFFFFFKKKVLK